MLHSLKELQTKIIWISGSVGVKETTDQGSMLRPTIKRSQGKSAHEVDIAWAPCRGKGKLPPHMLHMPRL